MTARPQDAAAFHALHAGPDVLILPNAWDAGSARLIETLGAKAIATTSAGVAWSHGYADGHHLPVDVLVATVAEIARVVTAPITTDIEGGYSDDPAAAGQAAARVIDAGAVGVNIEDGVDAPELLCRKIEAVRTAAERAGVKLFINARCDVYLRKLAEGEAALTETLKRGAMYRAAGADGLFAPFAADEAVIARVIAEVPLPFNAIARKGLPSLAHLKALGVRRLSAGTGVSRAAFEATRAAAAQFLADGESGALIACSGALSDLNALFKGA
jgi:2-methylisocitrate lyase-like PEP mutase family enzyme